MGTALMLELLIASNSLTMLRMTWKVSGFCKFMYVAMRRPCKDNHGAWERGIKLDSQVRRESSQPRDHHHFQLFDMPIAITKYC